MENDAFVTIAFIFPHKPQQTACVGFISFYRVRMQAFPSRDTGRNIAVKFLCIATVRSRTAKIIPIKTNKRTPKSISSV